MPVPRSLPEWMTTIGSDHTHPLATQHRRRSPPNWISNGLLRYAQRAPLRSPLLQSRSCAKQPPGSNRSWRKAGGHFRLAERSRERYISASALVLGSDGLPSAIASSEGISPARSQIRQSLLGKPPAVQRLAARADEQARGIMMAAYADLSDAILRRMAGVDRTSWT